MDITIHSSFLPQTDAEASLAFYRELVAKGNYFGANLATGDLDATFAALEAAGADIVQEPIEQDDGVRDAAVRDPAGNLLRIQQNTTTDEEN